MFDVIILGLGGMGGAAAFELARRGKKVLGLEQFDFGHALGSSHGQTRIIRQAYFEHPSYVPLAQRAFERWYDLEQRTGQHLFTECGCLNLGLPDGELVEGIRLATKLHSLAVEEYDPAQLRRRFPAFRFDDATVGVFEPRAGFLNVEDCVLAHIRQAATLGAELHDNEPALSWEASDSGVVVHTTKGTYRAKSLIVTAGSWAGKMLADLGLPLTVSRKTLLWYGTRDDSLFRRDRFPTYIADTPEGTYYGFPVIDGKGHKMARHDDVEPVTDPARVNREISAADQLDSLGFLAKHLPAVTSELRAGKVCLYTLTPDRHFIIDRHPRHANVVVAAGFSGHGFKFTSAIGEVLAHLALGEASPLAIDFFGIRRFRSKISASEER